MARAVRAARCHCCFPSFSSLASYRCQWGTLFQWAPCSQGFLEQQMRAALHLGGHFLTLLLTLCSGSGWTHRTSPFPHSWQPHGALLLSRGCFPPRLVCWQREGDCTGAAHLPAVPAHCLGCQWGLGAMWPCCPGHALPNPTPVQSPRSWAVLEGGSGG